MPLVHVVDDTFVRAEPAAVRAATRARWEGWLDAGAARLDLTLTEDRGVQGVRWAARGVSRRRRRTLRWTGTAEVWLEPAWGGTVVHLYVRLDPLAPEHPAGARGAAPSAGVLARHVRHLPDALRRSWKRGLVHTVGRRQGGAGERRHG